MSNVETAWPSRCAATPSNWETVTMPVPPTPAMTTLSGVSSEGSGGSARRARKLAMSPVFCRRVRGSAPYTETKEGQKPRTQEKS